MLMNRMFLLVDGSFAVKSSNLPKHDLGLYS